MMLPRCTCRCTFAAGGETVSGHMLHQHNPRCTVPGCKCPGFEQATEADLVDRTGAKLPANPSLVVADPSEEDLQREVARHLDALGLPCIWFHVPMGGARRKTEAAILKGLGAKAGIPDLVFLWRGGCGGIELKTATGKLRPAQGAVRDEFLALGIPWALCRSWEAVEATLKEWGLPEKPGGKIERAEDGVPGSLF